MFIVMFFFDPVMDPTLIQPVTLFPHAYYDQVQFETQCANVFLLRGKKLATDSTNVTWQSFIYNSSLAVSSQKSSDHHTIIIYYNFNVIQQPPPKNQNLVFNSKAAFFLFLSLSFDISFDRRTAVPVRHLPEDIYTEVCPYVAHPNSYGFVVTFIYYALHIPSHFFFVLSIWYRLYLVVSLFI